MANKTDAGNGSEAICRVSNVLRSPSPDPRRSAKEPSPSSMPEELPVTACPRCGSNERVRSKLITTNLLLQSHFVEPFTVDRPSQFRASPHTLGDYFVAGLFCDHCDLGFVPDLVAHEIGIEPCRYRGQITLAPRNYGIGYPRSDVSYDEQGRALRPFEAIIWQRTPDSVGVRLSLQAADVTEAHRILASEHGPDAIYSIWNEQDSEKLR
jgi:hypothetical protein